MKAISLILVLLLAIMGNSGAVEAASTLRMNPKRLVEVIDVIDMSQLPVAQKIDTLSRENTKPIYIFLNSPGGAVIVGSSIVDSIRSAQARGAKVICAVGTLAASMAFNILATCNERYALASSKLLFHPARIYSREPLTATMLLEAARDLLRTEKYGQMQLLNAMQVNKKWFDYHYNRETLWEAKELVDELDNDFLQLVDDITGSDKLFVIDRPKSMFDILFSRMPNVGNKPYKLIHIMGRPTYEYQNQIQ